MTSNPPPAGVARLGHGLLTTALTVAVVGAAAFIMFNVVGPVTGKDRTANITVNMPSSNISSLPSSAEVRSTVPVNVAVKDPSATQGLGILAAAALPIALVIFVLNELRKIVGTVRRGDPFIPDNVRRLRWIGYALVVGGFLVQLIPQFFLQAVAESAGVHGFTTHYDIPGALPLFGLGVLVLAHVFAHGVRLREDVEGTV